MVVTFLFVFILNWAEFLLALTLTPSGGHDIDGAAEQIPERLEGAFTDRKPPSGTVVTIPVVVLGLLIQKHLVKGFSFGTIRK
jgi:multiple sugar transport system permease protein